MSYVEGSALRTIFSRRSRLAIVALVATAMLGSGLILGLSSGEAQAGPVGAVVDQTHCYGLDEGTGDATEDQQWLHEVVLGAGGAGPVKLQPAGAQAPLDAAGNIEGIALRNDASELYVYDPAVETMFLVDVDTATEGAATDFNLSGLGDVDAMFFQNDTDGDLANDILWVLVDGDNAIGNDTLTGYNPAGAVVAGPVTVTTDPNTTIEGATWLPDANGGTGEFFISYTETAAGVLSTFASLGTGAVPAGAPTDIGTTLIDVEGLGTDGAGQLFLTTGEDGADSNNLYHVNEAGAATTFLLDMNAGAPAGGEVDFESIDCAFPGITMTKSVVDVTRNADGTSDVTFQFDITNTGELQLEGVTLTDPMTNFTVVSGPTPDDVAGDCSTAVATGTQVLNITETCTAVWSYVVDDAPGDYVNDATVTGTPPNGIAGPTTDDATTTATIPALAPDLQIVKTAVLDVADCPADFASGAAGLDQIAVANGDDVVYCINVINNGPGDAANVSVSDPLDPNDPRDLGTIAAGDEDAYSYTVTVANNPVVNVATVTGEDVDGGAAPPATDNAGTTEPVVAPDLQIVKTVVTDAANCPADFAAGAAGLDTVEVPAGTAVIYCINVINNGGDAVNVTVSDPQDPASPRSIVDLANGDEANFNYVVNASSASSTNTATVAGEDVAGGTATPATDDAGTTPAPPVLEIHKTVVATSAACPANFAAGADGLDTLQATSGSQVKYCIAVINSGTGNAFAVTVTDNLDAGSPRTLGDILPGGEQLYEYIHTVGANPETNTATVAGNDGDGAAVPSDTDEAGTIAQPPGSISNLVFEDTNGNDVQDAGEPGTPFVTVNLLASPGGPVIATTTTDASGNYIFPNLAPGTYYVEFVAPQGRTFVAQDVGGDDAADSDADANGATGAIVIGPGQDDDTVDAGLAPIGVGSISNFVFQDNNGDDVQDAGDTPVAGVTVNLLAAPGGAPIATTTTDGAGLYNFGNLNAGTYYVQFVAPQGRTFVSQDVGGDDAADSDPDPATGTTGAIVLAQGEDNDTVDAGLDPIVGPGSISNFVFTDENEDDVQDGGDTPVQGVTVNLLSSPGGAPIATTVTDAAGLYNFPGLNAGTYYVQFVAPGGRTFVSQDVGGDDAADSDPDPATGETGPIVLAQGENNDTVDAGLDPVDDLAKLGNFVWEDLNRNGTQDAGEPGIPGATVNVWATDAAGNIPANSSPTTVTTDANGEWMLDVAPGSYRINVVVPAGFVGFTTQDVGSDLTDSDIIASGGQFGFSGVYTVAAGQQDLTIDAGLVTEPPLAELGNFVFEDTNSNGQQDAGEPGIQGITVQVLDGAGAVVGSDVTDANGLYLVDMLPAGVYTVNFINTTGGTFTVQDSGADTTDSDANASGQTAPVTLAAGDSNLTIDAGIILTDPPSSISNFVFEDTNQDGIQDAGEPVVPGVTVNLWDAVNGAPGSIIGTTVTDAAGTYIFPNLQAGDYFVQFVAPANRSFTAQDAGADDTVDSDPDTGTGITAVISLGVAEDNTTVDAGLLPVDPPGASISNFVFEDTNEDGIQDAGEPGVGGVTVNLWDSVNGAPGSVVGTTVTDANGSYLFANLTGGAYFVQFVAPANRSFTAQDAGADDTVDSDPDTGTGITAVINLGANEDNIDVDAGLLPVDPPPVGSIANFVFEDTNEDGIQDAGESGIPGVTVNLWNSVNGAPGSIQASVVTDAAGNYIFSGLNAGDYFVQFVAPTGRTITVQDAGADDTVDSDPSPATGITSVIALAAGQDIVDVDAGITPIAPLGSIANLVFQDDDENGVQDAGEPGVPGVTVNLWTAVNGAPSVQVGTTVTDAAGEYLFSNVAAGDYIVQFIANGRTFTAQDAGADDTVDSDPAANGLTGVISLAASENNVDVDAGVIPFVGPTPGTVSDLVFEDTNGNGVQDAGEPGIPGVTVTLWSSVNGAPSAIVATTTTDASGNYSFPGLAAGAYQVQFTAPAGRVFTPADVGGDDAADSDPNPATGITSVIIVNGMVDPTVDAGLLPLDPPPSSSIADLVFEDTNGNNIQDAGEPGVPGVAVNLWSADAAGNPGVVLATTVTGLNGTYVFPGLANGDYIVEFVAPAGRTFVAANIGADDAVDSDAGANGQTGVITINGASLDTVDAGLAVVPMPATISDRVFEDVDGDGVQDAGEAGIPGITVNLLDVNGTVIGTTITDASGSYTLTNVAPGDYIVQFVAPGRTFSPADVGSDATDSDAGANGQTAVITVVSGDNLDTVDAGLLPVINPAIGIAKAAGTPAALGDGEVSIAYSFVLENLGNVTLTGVTITDDFAAAFAGATVVSVTPAGSGCSAAVAAAPGHTLAPGASCTAVWTVVVSGLVEDQTYTNSATATGTAPGGATVTDVSDNGVNPDPNGNGDAGDPGEDTGTPVLINLIPNAQPQNPAFSCVDNNGNIVVNGSCIIPQDPGTFTNAPSMTPTVFEVPAPAAQEPLAFTGSSANLLATLALALMGAGGALMIGARRRNDED